jgi:spermidine synthase
MTKVGEHITLDIIGTTKEYDPSLYEKVIHDIAKAAKVTILNISNINLNHKDLQYWLY